ncbi:MAG TPA: hypothetical protein PK083_03145 [Soehngenia sp.]|nr:hypothetical protein [Soehngenia sp.]
MVKKGISMFLVLTLMFNMTNIAIANGSFFISDKNRNVIQAIDLSQSFINIESKNYSVTPTTFYKYSNYTGQIGQTIYSYDFH